MSYGAGKRQWPARTPHTNLFSRVGCELALKSAGERTHGTGGQRVWEADARAKEVYFGYCGEALPGTKRQQFGRGATRGRSAVRKSRRALRAGGTKGASRSLRLADLCPPYNILYHARTHGRTRTPGEGGVAAPAAFFFLLVVIASGDIAAVRRSRFASGVR